MSRLPLSLAAVPPLAMDAGIAAATGLGAVLVDALGPDYRTTGALLWDVGLALPLVLRRRLPAVAAGLIGAVCLAQWVAGTIASGDVAVLVLLFTLGAWETRRWLLAASILVAEVGVVMAVTRWAPPSHAWLAGLMVTGTVSAAWVLGVYARTRRAYLVSMIERAETAERERDTRATIAVDAERARMAREMHDIIAHSLSVMITLNDAVAAVATTDAVRSTVTQASEVGRQALTEMHRLLGVLRSDSPPDLAPQPTAAQLSDLVAIVRSAGLSVELSVTGDLCALAPTAQLAVYRIVQESLTNVLKHARNVRQVDVEIANHAGHVSVRVTDDGEVAARADATTVGHGLAGMRERAGIYNGRFAAGPAHGGGWLVSADLDVAAQEVRSTMTVRVLLADDQPLLRQGFAMIIGAEPDLQVVGEAAEGFTAIELSRRLKPDVVLMDVRMPGLDGIAATRQITAEQPGVKVIILTTFDIDEYAFDGLRAGASGFLLKNARPEDLLHGIRTVAAGDAVLAPSTTRRVLDTYASTFEPPPAALRIRQDVLDVLTPREREIFTELAAGLTNQEIAERLTLSETTVKTHVTRVLSKLDLRDRVQVVIFSYENGLTRPGR